MLIEINGEKRQVNSLNLQSLCEECDLDPLVVATALNGDFVPRGERIDTLLEEGDQVEIFAPKQGG